MPTVKWDKLTVFEHNAGEIDQPWIPVVDTLRDYTHLRIRGEGRWSQGGGVIGPCGPDGVPGLPLQSDRLAVADCLAGALIGKLGGSSASLSVPVAANPPSGGSPSTGLAEGKAFAIGSYCVVTLPQSFIGPVFVSFNGLARPIQVERLKVTVEGAVAA
jgi:hypothetical protein